MEMMVVKCTGCKATLKFSAEKAGTKIPCPKCNAEVALPQSGDTRPKASADDDDAGGYQLAFHDDDLDRQKREEALNRKAEKKEKMRITVRRKNIGDLDSWAKVHHGCLFLMAGACVWSAAYGLQMLVVFLGLVQGPELGINAERFLFPNPNYGMFFLSLVSGSDFANTGRVLMIMAQVLTLIQAALWMTGFGMCLAIEPRMGSRGQLVGLFSLSGVNVLLNLFFRFLPLIGVLNYVLVPFYAPELVTGEVNTERSQPIHVGWMSIPTLEIVIALLVQTALLMEPILVGVFLWTVGQMLRDEPLENRAMAVIRIGFGVLFMILAYQIYACAGTSSVLLKVLRVFYTLWFAFQVGMIVKLATTCNAARDLLNFYLHPEP